MSRFLRFLPKTVPTVAPVPHRAVLSLGGSDVSEFLNGILASHVTEPKVPRYSVFLNAQACTVGRVLYDVFLYTSSDVTGKPIYLLDYDSRPSDAPSLISLLKRYVLRSNLTGVPEGQEDLPAMQAFPIESNLDIMGALDFRKGCYVGQELTVRTYHTGSVRKRILPVVIRKPGVPPDDTVTPSSQAPSYPSDISISSMHIRSPEGARLALLRLEQVEAAEQGELSLRFNVNSGPSEGTWEIQHWWPDWWPRRVEESSEAAISEH
ncbi:hypothetical protein C0993_004361 [Termitomyces sp. T159_Od127]|nr:hypothetical protein C0993_004361 [Termitomyces sp. T159_Od127]